MSPFELLLQFNPFWTHSLAWSQADKREGNIATKSLAWPLSLGFRLPPKATSFWPPLPQEMQEPKILGSHEPPIDFVFAKENLITTNLSKTKQRTRIYCTNLHLEQKLVMSGHIVWVYMFLKNISIKLVSENQYPVTSDVSNNSPNFPILVFSLTRAYADCNSLLSHLYAFFMAVFSSMYYNGWSPKKYYQANILTISKISQLDIIV